MPRLSIFNFESFQVRLKLSYWVGIFVLLVLLAETILRIPIVLDYLPNPEPTLWHTPLVQSKLDYLKDFESAYGIDVLFIGNSTVQSGMNPEIFDDERMPGNLANQGAFNAAIEGLPPYGVLLFLEIYLRYTQPSTIIYGVTPQDLNSNSPWAQDVTERVKHSPLVTAETGRSLWGKVLAVLLDSSKLLRYRLLLHQYILRGGELVQYPRAHFNARGYHPINKRLADLAAAERMHLLGKAGVLNYSTVGFQLDALQDLINLCRSQNIQLILVNMPLADEYYVNFDNQGDYQNYLSTLRSIADEFALPLLDAEHLGDEEGFNDTHFADLNHLNEAGATKLSTLVATSYNALANTFDSPQIVTLDSDDATSQ